jgi:hypothetical protein
MAWRIWCVVSGGVTGHREAWYKGGGVGGKAEVVLEYGTREEAEQVAADLMRSRNGPHATARFSYTVKPYPPDEPA